MKRTISPVDNLEAQAELETLVSNIRIARKRRKRSLADIAARTGISVSTLFRLESGDSTVSIGGVLKVLSVLGILTGLADIAAPENDVAQTLEEVRTMRINRRSSLKKTFSDDELNF